MKKSKFYFEEKSEKSSQFKRFHQKLFLARKFKLLAKSKTDQFRKSENCIWQSNQGIVKGHRRPYRKCFAFPISQENLYEERKERATLEAVADWCCRGRGSSFSLPPPGVLTAPLLVVVILLCRFLCQWQRNFHLLHFAHIQKMCVTSCEKISTDLKNGFRNGKPLKTLVIFHVILMSISISIFTVSPLKNDFQKLILENLLFLDLCGLQTGRRCAIDFRSIRMSVLLLGSLYWCGHVFHSPILGVSIFALQLASPVLIFKNSGCRHAYGRILSF